MHTHTHVHRVSSLGNLEATFYRKTQCFKPVVGNVACLRYFAEVCYVHLVRRKEKKGKEF